MSSLASALVSASTKDVEIPITRLQEQEDGQVVEQEVARLWFRIRPVTSEQMLDAGGSYLLLVQKYRAAEDGASADVRQAASALREQLQSPSAIRDSLRFRGAIVAAGVVAASKDGKVWEDIVVTSNRAEENASRGRLWIGSLPPQAILPLSREVLTLSTGGGAASERLASFL